MTELEELKQRRDLVVLAAELQRATIVRRLRNIEENPARHAFGLAASVIRRPVLVSLGTAALKFAVRAYRRRAARRKLQLNH